MDETEEILINKMLSKSQEAFMLAIEIYNKPTIKYRVEGFSFFICNAWELMLKAYMVKTFGKASIYYKDNVNRTLSLENCISKIFTNNKDPLRLNLEKIIILRNTSTHFITEEYEMVYVPLFQSCVLNFNEKMLSFHSIDMTSIIPQNFLTLSVSMKSLDDTEIVAKYPEEIAQKILDVKNDLEDLSIHSNEKFSIKIEHLHYITKNKDEATSLVKVDNNAESSVKIIKELKDPNNTHKYTTKSCIDAIRSQLTKENIVIKYNGNAVRFSSFHFNNFCKYYDLKDNEKLCYTHRQFSQPQYSYSQSMIDFILSEIKKDPDNILDNIKNKK